MNAHTHHHEHGGEEHHHGEKTLKQLLIAFGINMLLSVVEIVAGVLSGSVALIGDALHNTGDALSILIAVAARKIGMKGADSKYTYGYKRAESVGGFANLILLFVSGAWLLVEGIGRIVRPEQIDGKLIVWVSVLALIIDAATAKISHAHAHGNMNMKMLFVHNLADALGSVGVIVSGLCVMYLGWNFVDGIIAVSIALYMIVQSAVSFKPLTDILMNAAPQNIDLETLRRRILSVDGVSEVHTVRLWQPQEGKTAFGCHIVGTDAGTVDTVGAILKNEFGVNEHYIQVESKCCADAEK